MQPQLPYVIDSVEVIVVSRLGCVLSNLVTCPGQLKTASLSTWLYVNLVAHPGQLRGRPGWMKFGRLSRSVTWSTWLDEIWLLVQVGYVVDLAG